eukprot:COSAG02_NODE_9598_length_2166_cov_4.020319_1_plen_721_part_11
MGSEGVRVSGSGSLVEMVDSGIQLSSTGSVELSSGYSMHLAADEISAGVTSSLGAYAASVQLGSSDIDIAAEYALDVRSAALHAAATDHIALQSGGIAQVSAESLDASTQSSASLATAESFVVITKQLQQQASHMNVVAQSSSLNVHTATTVQIGETVTMSTESADVSASTLSMFSSESASVESSVVSVSSSEELDVQVGDFDLASSGAFGIHSSEDASVSALGLSMTALESIRIGASSVSVDSGSDVSVGAGGKLVGVIGAGVELVSDGASLSSAGRVEATAIDDVRVSALGGDLSAHTGGAVSVGSASGVVEVGDAASLAVGGSSRTSLGGDGTLSVGGRGNVVFGDGLSVVGGSTLSASGAEELSFSGQSVEVIGADGVHVVSDGSSVELGSPVVEFVGYVWRSPSSFSEYSNMVPPMANVQELVISSSSSGGAVFVAEDIERITVGFVNEDHHSSLSSEDRLESGSRPEVSLCSDDGVWSTVWSEVVISGDYSMNGLSISFGAQTVSGVKLSVAEGRGGSYSGWEEVHMSFGVVTQNGSTRVSSSRVMDIVSGETLTASSESVRVSAGGSLDVTAGEAVDVSGETVSVVGGSAVDVSSGSASVVGHESVDVFSGGAVSVAGSSASVASVGDVSVSSGSHLAGAAVSASVGVTSDLTVGASEVLVDAGRRLSSYAGESMTLSTESVDVSASTLSMFSSESASVESSVVSVSSSEELDV